MYERELIRLAPTEKKIAAILVDCAKNKRTICYSALAKRVGVGVRQVGTYAGNVGIRCLQLGLPMISVLVVSKTTGKASDGYKKVFKALNYIVGKGLTLDEIISDVYKQKDWNALLDTQKYDKLYPEEFGNYLGEESGRTIVTVNRYERDPVLRKKCIETYGTKCAICGFDASAIYGKQFDGKIHIHHIDPLHSKKKKIVKENDLIPVCPNCHMILHSKVKTKEKDRDYYYPNEVRKMLNLPPLI